MGWFYSPIRGKNFWKHLLMLSGLPQYNQSKLFLVFVVLDARFTFKHIANCDCQALYLLWQHKENHSILAHIKFTITTSTGWKDVHTSLLFHGWVKTKSGESSSEWYGCDLKMTDKLVYCLKTLAVVHWTKLCYKAARFHHWRKHFLSFLLCDFVIEIRLIANLKHRKLKTNMSASITVLLPYRG